MHARQHRDWLAGSQVRGEPYCGIEVEVELAACDSVNRCVRNVADIGEPFRAQQVHGDLVGRDANAGVTV
jgi:hypothetical protein